MAGCATAPPETPVVSPEKKLAAQQLLEIGNTCRGSYIAFVEGKSKAYCDLSEDLKISFTFQNMETYQQYSHSVASTVQLFCSASSTYSGKRKHYSWVFTDERQSYYRVCPKTYASK